MRKNKKINLLILTIILIFIGGYFSINYVIGKNKFSNLKLLLNNDQKQLVFKYIFPYKFISKQLRHVSQLEQQISHQEENIVLLKPYLIDIELQIKEEGKDIKIEEKDFKISNNKTLKKYKLVEGFYLGINDIFPGSGYVDFYQNNFFVLSSRGVLAYTKNISDKQYFRQIENNINDFIGIKQFSKDISFSLKDLFIFKNKIFISYTEEIKEDCWNTSVIYGNINYESIKFGKLFSPKECVHSQNNINKDKEFNAQQSGGRIINFDDNHILLSVGEYRNRYLAQNKESVNGKILKININNSNYEIISMGHRNPQGLYYDKEKNFILETEHGPYGGDEINLIEVNKTNKDKPLNYGWAIVSAGEHYSIKDGGKKSGVNKEKYEKYPLYKSHSEYGFVEPLKSFVPSIGISEITKIGENRYVASSMRDRSIYFFKLNSEKKIIDLERVEVFERVRDLIFKNDKLYLFLEDTASIGVISLN